MLIAAAPPPLNVYVSLPLQGSARPQSEDVVLGIKLAWRDRGRRAGGHPLRLVILDDSTAAEGKWDAGQTTANARKVADDDSAIAYIGEFNSGATANSLPILNQAGILQVSPSNEARGLTRSGAGASSDEPGRYYPTRRRTYGRVIPIDDVQAAAHAALMRRRGVRRLFVLDDAEIYGQGVATLTARAARRRGIRIVGRGSWDGVAIHYRGLAARVAATRPDAVFAGGIIDNNAPQLFNDLNAAAPSAGLYGPDGMAVRDFTRELRPGTQARTTLTAPVVAPSALPRPGRRFWRHFRAVYGKRRADTDPYALFGYAAAQTVLDAIDRGGNDRAAVIHGFFGRHRTALGRFRIQPSGDTSLRRYGVYRVHRYRLEFARAIAPRR